MSNTMNKFFREVWWWTKVFLFTFAMSLVTIYYLILEPGW